MPIIPFDDFEKALEAIQRGKEAANARVQPWQEKMQVGDCYILVWGDLTIYGEIIESPYKEDQKLLARPENRYLRFVRAFSKVCPDGEISTEHVANFALRISKDDVEWAREHNWPGILDYLIEKFNEWRKGSRAERKLTGYN